MKIGVSTAFKCENGKTLPIANRTMLHDHQLPKCGGTQGYHCSKMHNYPTTFLFKNLY